MQFFMDGIQAIAFTVKRPKFNYEQAIGTLNAHAIGVGVLMFVQVLGRTSVNRRIHVSYFKVKRLPSNGTMKECLTFNP